MVELLRKNIIIVLFTIVVIIVIITQLIDKEDSSIAIIADEPIMESVEMVEEEYHSEVILVDIKGAVLNPGVYEMKSHSRVKDVVERAGGFTKEANQHEINLAQKLFDEMIIIVPEIGEEDIHSVTYSQSNKIRINYASVDEIQQLPGIGPSKANAIVQYREERGFFRKVEDLLQVSGIGEKILEAIREEIQVP